MSFAVVFPFLKLKNMKDDFKEAFDSPMQCSVGRRILVFGVLYNLFIEFASFPIMGKKCVELNSQWLSYSRAHC
jgi:hypothetical protein